MTPETDQLPETQANTPTGEGLASPSCYGDAITELQKCLEDAKRNRSKEDPERTCERWSGFLEGIGNAIYRLEMNSHNSSVDPSAP